MILKKSEHSSGLFFAGILFVALVVIVIGGGITATGQDAVTLGISKSVNVVSVVPGQAPAPIYTVTFSNPNTTTVVIDSIADTLPIGFQFVDMHPSSDWPYGPDDDIEPVITWLGPITVPATGTLSLVYSVFVPGTVLPSITPYVNSVVAVAEGNLVGPTTAKLLVGEADLALSKTVWPERVINGGIITYTVALTNSGYVSSTVDLISDTLDPSLTFLGMADDSDVLTLPQTISNALVWTGALQMPPLSSLHVRYRVATSAAPGWSYPCNRVDVHTGDGALGPAETCITVGPEKAFIYLPLTLANYTIPRLAIDKSASPTSVMAGSGETIVYTVDILNDGYGDATIQSVYDLLPSGFSFVSMEPGSDVSTNPSGTSGTITWNGPFVVPGNGQLTIIYRVSPSAVPGDYVNTVDLTPLTTVIPPEPASATVTVEPATLLEDDFEDSNLPGWEPFLNYGRLGPGQWYWDADDGFNSSGGVTQDRWAVPGIEAEDALMMYLAPGAEDWTNYRLETKIILRTVNYPHGVWVRGQYEDVGSADPGGWATGYYIMVGGSVNESTHFVRLMQLQTLTDCWGNACNNPGNLYDFNNPHELISVKKNGQLQRYQWYTLTVEVNGNRIKAWLNGDLYIDYVDTKEPFLTGTIGLKTFKADTVSFDDVIVTPLD